MRVNATNYKLFWPPNGWPNVSLQFYFWSLSTFTVFQKKKCQRYVVAFLRGQKTCSGQPDTDITRICKRGMSASAKAGGYLKSMICTFGETRSQASHRDMTEQRHFPLTKLKSVELRIFLSVTHVCRLCALHAVQWKINGKYINIMKGNSWFRKCWSISVKNLQLLAGIRLRYNSIILNWMKMSVQYFYPLAFSI